ncbi:hypothetical protein Tco_1250983, partial [Tanacetum coccineum]
LIASSSSKSSFTNGDVLEGGGVSSNVTLSDSSIFLVCNKRVRTQTLASQIMVLQLTDFTSEITDEELREFTSEYYIPSALHPVVPAADASIADFPVGKGGCYTEKLDALRRWREMFFWVDDALVPWNFAFYTQGLLPRDERPPPGSYSMEDAELINENLSAFGNVPAGRTMELVLEQPEIESTDVLAPTPLRSVPSVTVEPPMPDATSIGSSEDADVAEVDSGLKRKRATGDDGAGPSKRVRHLSLGLSTSTEEESSDASPTHAAKEVTETPPPNVEATSDSSAPVTHAAQSPPQTGPKAFDGMPVDQLIEEFDMVTAQQAALVAQLRARVCEVLCTAPCRGENGTACQGGARVARMPADTRLLSLGCEVLMGKQEEKLRKLSIEYDEELYPHMLSTIAERRWLISHGLRLAAMSTLESQEVRQSFGDVVKCALARGKAEAVEELLERRLLTVPAAQVPGYNQKAYEELVAAMEAMKLLELPHIAQLERDQDYPIGVIMAGLTLARHATEGAEAQPDYFLKPDLAQLQVPIFARPRDILNPFALEKEVPLKIL